MSVLIVGAGPTGLVLALWLRRQGVAFRIIEQHAGPGETSRALIIHARTLEFYAQLGLAERVIAAGTRVEDVRLREAGEDVAGFSLKEMGQGLSAYPFALCLPQDEHERLLGEVLAEQGVAIEWGTGLQSLAPRADAVWAVLSRDGQEEGAEFDFVAGCDGAHSRVREALGISLEGGTYDRLYYVADVKPRSPPGATLVVALDRDDFALMLPSRRGENERLIGFVPPAHEAAPLFEHVRADAHRLLGIEVEAAHWFSTYRVHHRVASAFRAGRCFLLGDAAHLHSPVGGQGMNTGIGDAVNLGWKLGAVLRGDAPPALLDSYQPERMGFARSLVATTDRAFQTITDPGLVGRVFRGWVMPRLVPALSHVRAGRHAMFRLLSQIRIAYPDSMLSVGGGERMAWVPGAGNFAALDGVRWQLQVFGTPPAPVATAAASLGLAVRRFDWTEAARAAGLRRDVAYLVRPDGHQALLIDGADAAPLLGYAQRLGLRFSG